MANAPRPINQSVHNSIMVEELLTLLQPHSEGAYLDATFGGGGHSLAILEASSPNGQVVGIDRDPTTRQFAQLLLEKYPQRFRYKNISYKDADQLSNVFDGIIADLGYSSDQLAALGRGFSFERNEPLDLRFNPESGQTAAQFLQQATIVSIGKVFREYAQDRYWKVLARKIVATRRERPIRTTADLKEIVGTADPSVLAPIWQGLRIQVNDELTGLKQGLMAMEKILKPNGILAVITFHSLEDRIVKEFFRTQPFVLINKKPIEPKSSELEINRRARSAKLRAGRKVDQ